MTSGPVYMSGAIPNDVPIPETSGAPANDFIVDKKSTASSRIRSSTSRQEVKSSSQPVTSTNFPPETTKRRPTRLEQVLGPIRRAVKKNSNGKVDEKNKPAPRQKSPKQRSVKPVEEKPLTKRSFKRITPAQAYDRALTKLAIKLNKEAEEKAAREGVPVPTYGAVKVKPAPREVVVKPCRYITKPHPLHDPGDRAFGWQYRRLLWSPTKVCIEPDHHHHHTTAATSPTPPAAVEQIKAAPPPPPTPPVVAAPAAEAAPKKRKLISLGEYTEGRKKQRLQ